MENILSKPSFEFGHGKHSATGLSSQLERALGDATAGMFSEGRAEPHPARPPPPLPGRLTTVCHERDIYPSWLRAESGEVIANRI